MLVLSRKPGESISIGNDVQVKVVKVEGHKVTLAFTAPERVLIMRNELLKNAPPKHK